MATSQNGWSVITASGSTSLTSFKWVTGKIRKGDVATIFADYAAWYNEHIEPIRVDWSWGWNVRPIRGKTTGYSNHASGTAMDTNAPLHPQRAQGSPWTLTQKQRALILDKLHSYGGVLRHGMQYTIGKRDEMHVEVVGNAAQVAAVAAAIRKGKTPAKTSNAGASKAPTKKPAASKPAAKGKTWPAVQLPVTTKHTKASDAAWRKLMADVGYKNKSLTVNVQNWLRHLGYYKGRIDGKWQRMTTKALQSFLRAKGLYSKAYLIDGKRGPATIKAEIRYLNQQARLY